MLFIKKTFILFLSIFSVSHLCAMNDNAEAPSPWNMKTYSQNFLPSWFFPAEVPGTDRSVVATIAAASTAASVAAFWNTINKQLAEGGEGAQAVIAALKALAKALQKIFESENSEGIQALKNVAAQINEQIANNPDIQATVTNAFKLLRLQIENNGEATKIIKKIQNHILSAGIKLGVIAVLTAGAIYGTRVLWNQIDRYLSTPKLIIESSQKSLWQKMTGILIGQDHLPEMVFSPELKRDWIPLLRQHATYVSKLCKDKKM